MTLGCHPDERSLGIPEIRRLGRAVRYVTAAGAGFHVAVERAATSPEALPLLLDASPASLVCLVGPGAGIGEVVAGASAALREADIEIVGASSSGRTSVFAVEPQVGEAALRVLHDVFFTSAAGEAPTRLPSR